MLLIRRLIFIICFVLSLLFLSFYGGNLPYMLFFAIVINSMISVGYILYVYFSVKIYQEIPVRRVTKHESIRYKLVLQNESLIAYRDITLKFADELSLIKLEDTECMGMNPGSRKKLCGELVCNYSGTYYVGVDSIEIMDYFKILRIKFQMPQKLKVTVKPRVLMPENLSLLYEDSPNSSLWGNQNYLPDSEVHKFSDGDNKNYIHWKNTAKRMELMVRNRATEENFKFLIMMDGCVNKNSFIDNIISADKLRETLLAFVNYIYLAGYSVKAFLGDSYENEICSKKSFDLLYQKITDYNFGTQQCMMRMLEKADRTYASDISFILITAGNIEDSKEAYEMKYKGRGDNGRKIMVINVDLYKTVEDIWKVK